MADRIVPRTEGKKLILAFNKIDKIDPEERSVLDELFSNIEAPRVYISAKKKQNIEILTCALLDAAGVKELQSDQVLIGKVKAAMTAGLSGELLSLDLHDCLDAIGSVTGEISSQEVLNNVFEKFCIGK